MGNHRLIKICFLILLPILLQSCRKPGNARSAFYYWKSDFSLTRHQEDILRTIAGNTLYLRLFDIKWDDRTKRAFPDAEITFSHPAHKLNITPVIFITNKTFENIPDD